MPGRRGLLAAALLLLGSMLVFFAAKAGLTAPRVPQHVSAPNAPGAPALDRSARDFSRFALNALLVPLLDDSEPPRWSDAALFLACGPATRVEVDGRPLVAGAPIPAQAFTVRWTMDACTQLDAFELSGVVELLVFHEDTGLSAVVSAARLGVASAGGVPRFEAPFAAALELVAAGDAGPHGIVP
jgi:hypothetical protein